MEFGWAAICTMRSKSVLIPPLRANAQLLIKGLLLFLPPAISPPMKSTGAKISSQITRGRIALRDGSHALKSLLLLGLTRGCRVL